jgi:capsular polysaccharide biosynthesis protein
MSEQALDLRGTLRAVKRYKYLAAGLLVVGIAGGGAYSVAHKPSYQSSALVVLAAGPNIETEAIIASSNPVLSAALPEIRPPVSLTSLQKNVTATSVTTTIVSISATAGSASAAESEANAVAKSYVAYLTSSSVAPLGRVPAQILEAASSATGGGKTLSLVIDLLVGAVVGALLVFMTVTVRSRADNRLRVQDAIADAVGAPVIAAIPVAHPRDTVAWADLLREYRPEPVHAWRLRQALLRLGVLSQPEGADGPRTGAAISVFSLSSDPGAIAVGPQLAAFAASAGMPTALVVGPLEDDSVATTLRAAALAFRGNSGAAKLDVITSPDQLTGWERHYALAVVISTVDGQEPRIRVVIEPTTTVLAVSAGGTRPQELARVAMNMADTGHQLDGIFVADPEPTDTTTGQATHMTRPNRRSLPTRMDGRITEIAR